MTRNPEMVNTLVRVFPNMWRLGRVRGTKFGMDVSNKMLPNAAAECQSYSFYHFWGIEGKATGGKITPPPPHLSPILPKLGLRFVFFSENNLLLFVNNRYIPPIYLQYTYSRLKNTYFVFSSTIKDSSN